MSKKIVKHTKKEKSQYEKSPWRVALPVVIGVVLVLLIGITVLVASRPDYNAEIDKPNGTYIKLGDYEVKNGKLYLNLRYNYGVTELSSMVDADILKNVTYTEEEYNDTVNRLKFGDEYEDMTDKEKEDALKEFEDNLYIAGYRSEDLVNKYFDLETKRVVFAKNYYETYRNDTDFTAEEYQTGYEEKYAKEDPDRATVIVVPFNSEEEAKSVMKMFGIYTESLSYTGWKHDNDTSKYFTRSEVELAFIKMYNYMLAYYQGGNVADYYDEDGNLKANYELLKEGVSYEFVPEVAADTTTGTLKQEAYYKFDFTKVDSKFAKFEYTDEEATKLDATIKSKIMTSLESIKDNSSDPVDAYTYSPTELSSGTGYFLALKLDGYEAKDLEYDFSEERASDKLEPTEELKAEIKDYLLESTYNDYYQSLMLIINRNNYELKINDNALDGLYAASYDNLYSSYLKITDYPTYEYTKKNSKTIVFSYKDLDGNKKEITAQALFEALNAKYGAQGCINLMNTYYVLSNKDFNTIYNPYTGETYDNDLFQEKLTSLDYNNFYNGTLASVKEWKYAFEQDSFKSYGFPSSYGWENFLKDYMRVENEKEFIASLALSDAYDKYGEGIYTYEDIVKEMQKIWNQYYALDVVNMIAFVDYNVDGTNDTYELEEGKEQEFYTAEQIAKAKELCDLFFEKAPTTGKDGLEAQLSELATEYKTADINDATWGQYKLFGLHVKVEAEASYNNSSSLVKEFLTVMEQAYKDIDEQGNVGVDLSNNPYYEKLDSFPTVYGIHKIAIMGTTEPTYINADKGTDVTELTEKEFELYEKMQEADYSENKDKVLEELGFEEELSDEKVAAYKAYYATAVTTLEGDNYVDYAMNKVRSEKVASGEWVYTDSTNKEIFIKINDYLKADLEETLFGEDK